MRWLPLAVLAGVVVVSACSSDGPTESLTVEAGETGIEMWFDPSDPVVTPGRYEITLDNVGTVHHELAVVHEQGRVLGARSIAGGTSTTFEVDLSQPGEYDLVCREPGHVEAGMVGTLTVE